MKYRRNYEKLIWGSAVVEAKSEDEARDRFDTDDADDYFDNKSEITWENNIEVE